MYPCWSRVRGASGRRASRTGVERRSVRRRLIRAVHANDSGGAHPLALLTPAPARAIFPRCSFQSRVAQLVEQTAVNRRVAGSSPAAGVFLEGPGQTPHRGSIRDRNHSAIAASSSSPDAKAGIFSTTSSSGVARTRPLRPRKMTAARNEIRLFPSRKGWPEQIPNDPEGKRGPVGEDRGGTRSHSLLRGAEPVC